MKLNFLELSENIAEGQRVENFIVQHRNEDKIWFNSFEGHNNRHEKDNEAPRA